MHGQISASMMCADLMHLEDSVHQLEKSHVEWLHCDVMDGHFVPNWMMFPDMINALAKNSTIPMDVHLMIENPSEILPSLKLRDGDMVSFHYESTPHIQRIISMIRDRGWIPAVALNPATPLELVKEILPELGMLLVMTVNPGFAGQKLVPNGLSKISRARQIINNSETPNILIEVDGNCSLINAPLMIEAGADILVAGTSSVFNSKLSIEEGVTSLRAAMSKARHA